MNGSESTGTIEIVMPDGAYIRATGILTCVDIGQDDEGFATLEGVAMHAREYVIKDKDGNTQCQRQA